MQTEAAPKYFNDPRSDCIDDIFELYEHKESVLKETIQKLENISKTIKTNKNGLSIQVFKAIFNECPAFLKLLLLSGFRKELGRLKFDESKRRDWKKTLTQLKNRNDGGNIRPPLIRGTECIRHSNVENSEPNKSPILSNQQRQTTKTAQSIFNGKAPILTRENPNIELAQNDEDMIGLPRTDDSICDYDSDEMDTRGIENVNDPAQQELKRQIQQRPLMYSVESDTQNSAVSDVNQCHITQMSYYEMIRKGITDLDLPFSASDVIDCVKSNEWYASKTVFRDQIRKKLNYKYGQIYQLFSNIRAQIKEAQQIRQREKLESRQSRSMCIQLQRELAKAQTRESITQGLLVISKTRILQLEQMLSQQLINPKICFVQPPNMLCNPQIMNVNTDTHKAGAVNPTQSDNVKIISMTRDVTEMEEKTEKEVSDISAEMVQKRDDEQKCESKAQFTPIKFNNYAKNVFYIARAKIEQKMELCSEHFTTYTANDGSLALNYFRQRALIQINDGHLFMIKTANADVIVIINIDLTFKTGETMYLIAVPNDANFSNKVKWKIDAFMSATDIQSTFAIELTKLPSSSSNMPQFIDALGRVPTNDDIWKAIWNTDFTKVRTKMPNKSLPVTEITESKFKSESKVSLNSGIMVACVVVKGKNHWIEQKKIVTFRDCYGQKQSIMISLRYLTANKQWIIPCLDYDIGRVYYQHRLVGTNNENINCYSWDELYGSITTVLKIV